MTNNPSESRYGARARIAAAALVLIALAGWGLASCSGDSEGDTPTPSASAGASPGASGSAQPNTPLGKAAAQVNQQYLNAPAPTTPAAAIASVKGDVFTTGGKKVPGTAELLSVQAGPNSTAVRWRMSTDDPDVFVVTSPYQTQEIGVPDVSSVTLVAKQANLLLKTGHWYIAGRQGAECTCSWTPTVLGPAGMELSILYPALPDSVTEVEMRVPGFPALVGPVTRS